MRRVPIAVVLAAEILVLSILAFSASSGPGYGVAVRSGAASISMTDQRNVVGAITVQDVVTPVNGWLVVQADWNRGVPDDLLGKRWIPAGESHDVTIGLDPTLPTPRRVFVTLLVDRGRSDVLEFNIPDNSGMAGIPGLDSAIGTGGVGGAGATKDKPLIAGSALVSAHVDVVPLSFAVGPTQAVISEATRTANADSVVIPRVVAPAQSWIAVSLEVTQGQTGGVLGTKLVPAGEHRDVVVPLSVRLGPSPVVATLHADLGKQGRFDFSPADLASSIDLPYVAGGRTVSAPVHFADD